MSVSKKLFTNSFIYVLSDVLNKAVPFLMLPILTRYLTPSDYGIISIFTVLVSILSIFVGLNIHGAINVNFFKMNKEKLKVFIGNCMIILNISATIVFILLYFTYSYISLKLNIDSVWIFVAAILAFANFLTTINLLLWMAEENPKLYGIYQISQTFVVASLSIFLVVGMNMGVTGQLLATSIGSLLFSFLSFVFIIKRGYLLFSFKKDYIKEALAFGIPLIPHSLSGWIKTGADRIVLMGLVGASATGIYSTGYQIGMIMSVLVSAFHKAWTPYLYKLLSNSPTKEIKEKVVKITYAYFVIIFMLAILFSYLANILIPYFLGAKFIGASEYIIYFMIAFAFQGMYFMVVNYIFYEKKTYILAYITFGTAIIHIGLLYWLIAKNGSIGAAQATMISFAITFFAIWFYASKVYNMPWNILKKGTRDV